MGPLHKYKRKQLNATLRRLLNCQTVEPITVDSTVEGSLTRVSILAYTGGLVTLEDLPLPVVFDLASTQVAKSVVMLYGHDRDTPVGHFDSIKIDVKQIQANGILSVDNARSQEIKKNAANGFPWQASVGIFSDNLEYVPEGKTVTVNGQSFTGPIYVAHDNTLREISILTIGADPNTNVSLLSANLGNITMTFEEWVKSLNFDPAGLTPEQTAALQSVYDKMMADGGPGTAEAPSTAGNVAAAAVVRLAAGWVRASRPPTPTVPPVPVNDNSLETFRRQRAAEQDRIDRINSLSVQYGNPTVQINGSTRSLAATAIEGGWNLERAELEMMRTARPVNVGASTGRTDGITPWQVLEAALGQSARIGNLEQRFTPQVLQAAHTQYRSRLSLQQLLYEAAVIQGYTGSVNVRANLRSILTAAFSTQFLVDILANTANKQLLDGYTAVDETWRAISKITPANDFKEFSSYRGVGGFTFEKIAKDGMIPHGEMSELDFANKVDTYAKMYAITRQDIYNDDLGVFDDVPRQLGRGGAIKFNKVFWTEFLATSPAFWDAGNTNVSTGVLGIAGLTAANTVFVNQRDANNDFLMAVPKFVLVPPALLPTAMSLYKDLNVVSGNTTAAPAGNPWAGKFQPISSPYLSDSTITGNSSVKYYLLADPRDVPVIEAAFLDGQQTPIVETADVDFNQLGIQMRGYFDFGVRRQDPRGGVQSSGA